MMTSVAADNRTTVAPAVVLTIAGSEATGGAGAQADLKTFQELGVFGIANLTCIVSFDPNNDWNHRFVPVDQDVIAHQLEATTAAYGAGSGAPLQGAGARARTGHRPGAEGPDAAAGHIRHAQPLRGGVAVRAGDHRRRIPQGGGNP